MYPHTSDSSPRRASASIHTASLSNQRRRDQRGVGAIRSHGERPAFCGSTLIAARSRHRVRGTSHSTSPARTSSVSSTPRSASSSSIASFGARMEAERAHASNEPAAELRGSGGATSAGAVSERMSQADMGEMGEGEEGEEGGLGGVGVGAQGGERGARWR
eukprot:scaffold51199_cov33-Tisochrysis_lutea.AAC.1